MRIFEKFWGHKFFDITEMLQRLKNGDCCARSESRTRTTTRAITERILALLVSVTQPRPLRLKLCRYEKKTYRAFGVVCGTNVLPKTSRCGGCSGLQRTWILCSRLLLGTRRIRLLRTSLLASPVVVARPLALSVGPAATLSRSHRRAPQPESEISAAI